LAATGEGVEALWGEVMRHQRQLDGDGSLDRRRRERLERELRQVLAARIEGEIRHLTGGREFSAVVDDVVGHRLDPYEAADRLIREVGRSDPDLSPTR
jgi:LAO/AO transport system kinase